MNGKTQASDETKVVIRQLLPRSEWLCCLAMVACLSAADAADRVAPLPAPVRAERNGCLILRPISTRVMSKAGASEPVLKTIPDEAGCSGAWQAVEVPAEPGSALVWSLDVRQAGDYDVYAEFQLSIQNQLEFLLALGDASITGRISRTDSDGRLSRSNGPVAQFVLQHLGRFTVAAGRQSLTIGEFSCPSGLVARIGAICLCPARDAAPDYRGLHRQIDATRSWVAPEKLALPRLIGDHMVLQRETQVPIWGLAPPGARVVVEFLGQKKRATADVRGCWRVLLDPLKAGGPYDLVIRCAGETLTLTDVLVGEVWLGAGQSNMTWALAIHPGMGPDYKCDQETIDFVGKGDYPKIRISSDASHLVTTNYGGWTPMPAVETRLLPALMTCAAIKLQRQLQVPVGVIVRSFGGTTGRAWLDRDSFENDPLIQKKVREDRSGVLWADGGGLYAGYIAPVLPYAIRGIVWDQGETGTGIPGLSHQDLLTALIGGWRKAADKPGLPFIYMRKDQYGAGPEFTNTMSGVALAWMVDNEGLIHVTHPPDKLKYAERLVQVMLNRIYRSE
ncbi:MAG: hypothetical protein PHR35_12460 [Kiritimatiellae bacterium]|nr:hypothetical protein [Kiritimatiellia bacterium]